MSHDLIKDKEYADRIEAFKMSAYCLRSARENVRLSEEAVKNAEASLKRDKMVLDAAHVEFRCQAVALGFMSNGSPVGSVTLQENLLSITGDPTPPTAPFSYSPGGMPIPPKGNPAPPVSQWDGN